MSFGVYKYDHEDYGPIMLLLEVDQTQIQSKKPKVKEEQFVGERLSEPKQRGISYRPPIPSEKKNFPQQRSLEKRKSVDKLELPIIRRKK